MGKKIIAEDSEDEEDMSIRSSTITMDMLEKAEDQFWEESIDTGEGSYDDFDSDGSDLEKEDDDDGLGEGTVLLRRKRRKNTSNSNNKLNEESRATRTLENSILRKRQFASMENARKIVQGRREGAWLRDRRWRNRAKERRRYQSKRWKSRVCEEANRGGAE